MASKDYKWGAIKGRKTQPRTSVDGLKISARRNEDGHYLVHDAETGKLVGYLGGRYPGAGWFALDADGEVVVEQVQVSRTVVASRLKAHFDRRQNGEFTAQELLDSARAKLTRDERRALREHHEYVGREEAIRDSLAGYEEVFAAIANAPSQLAALRVIEKALAERRTEFDRLVRDRRMQQH